MDRLRWDDPRFRRVKMELPVTLPMVRNEDGTSKGFACFHVFATDVADTETGEDIGIISGGTGHLVIHDQRFNEFWMIRHDEIWHAFCDALDRPYGALSDAGKEPE